MRRLFFLVLVALSGPAILFGSDSGITPAPFRGAAAGGDLLGTYPNPTVNWAVPGTIGSTTPNTVKATTVTDTGLTSGRVPHASTGGLLADTANLTDDGSTQVAIGYSTSSTSITTGAFKVAGGIGCSGAAFFNGQINGLSYVLGTSGFLVGNNAAAYDTSRTQPVIYGSGSGGSGYPFTAAGHLVISPRISGAQRDVIIATGSTPTETLIVTGTNRVLMGTTTDDGANLLQANGAASIASGVNQIRTRRYILTGVNANSATTDNAITGLPAKWIITKCTLYDASTSMTTATFGLFTSTGGGGTTLVTNAAQAGLTAATKFVNATIAASGTTDYQTATTIQFRVGTAQGGAATVSVCVEVIDLH